MDPPSNSITRGEATVHTTSDRSQASRTDPSHTSRTPERLRLISSVPLPRLPLVTARRVFRTSPPMLGRPGHPIIIPSKDDRVVPPSVPTSRFSPAYEVHPIAGRPLPSVSVSRSSTETETATETGAVTKTGAALETGAVTKTGAATETGAASRPTGPAMKTGFTTKTRPAFKLSTQTKVPQGLKDRYPEGHF